MYKNKRLIIDFPEKFQKGQYILFNVLEGKSCEKYYGITRYDTYYNSYFISFQDHINSIIFSELGINREAFMYKYFNSHAYGSWPEVSSLKDLYYMLKILSTLNEL